MIERDEQNAVYKQGQVVDDMGWICQVTALIFPVTTFLNTCQLAIVHLKPFT
jgi:hypothetical protein